MVEKVRRGRKVRKRIISEIETIDIFDMVSEPLKIRRKKKKNV